VSSEVWGGDGVVLADTSAWIVARRAPRARALFLSAVERADVAWCWPVRYELMIDARGIESISALDRILERLREVAVDRSVQRGVLAAMRELAGGGSHGSHRFPLTDLTVAVAAQQSGLTVLHHDRHFERLADLLGVNHRWISEPTD